MNAQYVPYQNRICIETYFVIINIANFALKLMTLFVPSVDVMGESSVD